PEKSLDAAFRRLRVIQPAFAIEGEAGAHGWRRTVRLSSRRRPLQLDDAGVVVEECIVERTADPLIAGADQREGTQIRHLSTRPESWGSEWERAAASQVRPRRPVSAPAPGRP